MILGAGPFQLPVIRKAVDLGCHVITVDYLPNNIGHKASHQYVNCSTADREGVLQAAKRLHIDGICTFSSDVAIPTVGYVCDNLGLPGVPCHVAETMSNKHLFRAFIRKHNLASPHFVVGKNFEEVNAGMKDLHFPVVFKPVDSSGSRGVTKLEEIHSNSAYLAFERAKGFSRSQMVCVEEFLEGIEVGGDGIIMDGHFAFIAITQKHLDGFLVTGHSLPTNISMKDQQRVIMALEQCCHALGYFDGPLNFDVMVSADQVTIIEISARNGGNGIPSIIEVATGVDVELASLKYALGKEVDFPSRAESIRACGSYIFGNKFSGMLQYICNLDELRSIVPEVFALNLAIQSGEQVEPFVHNGNLIGCVLFAYNTTAEYVPLVNKIAKALNLVIKV